MADKMRWMRPSELVPYADTYHQDDAYHHEHIADLAAKISARVIGQME